MLHNTIKYIEKCGSYRYLDFEHKEVLYRYNQKNLKWLLRSYLSSPLLLLMFYNTISTEMNEFNNVDGEILKYTF